MAYCEVHSSKVLRRSVIGLPRSQSKVSDNPEVKRRRLRVVLRQERDAANLTQKEAAEALDWSVSKIIRIEQGAVAVTVTDLRALLDIYKVTDEKRETELVELARGSKKQAWSEYKDVYGPAARTLFGNEAAAKIIYKYEPTFVPGILQTEEYARAVLQGLGHSEDEIDRMVEVRLGRQELLDRDPPLRLQFILGEAAVSRAVGGRGVMRHQLDKLKELAKRSEISLQVLPFSVGAHPRMGEAFTILEFADDLDDLLYLENAGRESTSREEPELISDYRRDFVRLQDLASDADDFSSVIDRISTRQLAPQNGRAPKEGEPAPAS
jgi:transcriptional regulator with XRE-family HTH domain